MSDIPNEHEADEEKLRAALNRWKLDDPPPDPPVEAMWEEIRTGLPRLKPGAGGGGGPDLVGNARPRHRTRSGVRSMENLAVWIPALMAAGLAGVMFGRWTAPDLPPAGSDGAPPSGLETPAIAYSDGSPEGPAASGGETGDEGVRGEPAPQEASPIDTPTVQAPVLPSDSPRFAFDPPSSAADAGGAGVLGRSVEGPASSQGPDVPSSSAIPGEESAIRFATTRHLLEVGPMLTRLAGGADPEAGTVPSEIRSWADQLLAETRFLLDDPEPVDPGLLALLEDLEMLLAQVVTLPPPSSETARVELELIAEGMSERRILPRIHTFAYGGTDQ